ncbi:DUF4424 family protein, partial [Rhizobium ruizarguesonis]
DQNTQRLDQLLVSLGLFASRSRSRGLVYPMAEGDADGTAKVDLVTLWTLRSTYWWRTTFPAKKKVSVEHRYKPAVGGTVAI